MARSAVCDLRMRMRMRVRLAMKLNVTVREKVWEGEGKDRTVDRNTPLKGKRCWI
jgi:hypothetical protein